MDAEREGPDAENLLDMSSRSAKPPERVYYVTWGRARLATGRLYRDRGWARSRVKSASESAHFARIYEGRVEWLDVTELHGDVINDAEIHRLLTWAGRNRWRRLLLEEPRLARAVMDRPVLDRMVDRASGLVSRVRTWRQQPPTAG